MKNILLKISAILFAIGFPVLIWGEEAGAGSYNILILQNEDGETLGAAPIADGTKITFQDGNVVLSLFDWSDTVSQSDFNTFTYVDEYKSDFKVKITCGNRNEFNLEGLLVSLYGDALSDFYGITQLTDKNGNTTFRDIPSGVYTLSIAEFKGTFNNVFFCKTVHGKEDTVEIRIDETQLSGVPFVNDSGFDEPQYFDMNGIKVRKENMSPGIYIRISSAGQVEKIVIR